MNNQEENTISVDMLKWFSVNVFSTTFYVHWFFYMTGRKHRLLIDLTSHFFLLTLFVLSVETENNLRDNAPETFDHRWVGLLFLFSTCQLDITGKLTVLTWCVLDRDAMIASVPSYEEPYIKVPRVLSMD